jgi:hypothetical protein
MSDDTLYQLYRCPSASGTKDWAIGIGADGNLRIRYCATGQTARLEDIPAAALSNAQAELRERIAKKLQKGYQYVSEATIKKGHLVIIEPAPPPVTETAIDWEIRPRIEPVALLERLAWAVERLGEVPLPDRIVYEPVPGICSVFAKQMWQFGFSDEGGLFPDGHGGGKIVSAQGVLPLLIMTTLQRAFPDRLRLSDELSALVWPRISKNDSVFGRVAFNHEQLVVLGSQLRLCLGPLKIAADLRTAPSVWF